MSTSRLNRKSQIFSQEGQSGDPLILTATHPHVQSQSLLDRQSPNDFQNIGSDGEPITSPYRGQLTNNSNESVPIRSAQEHQYSAQSYSYDFLYDPEVAKRGSDVSNKQSSNSAAIRSITSPHVFMLSQDAADQNNRSATTSVAGGEQRRNSLSSSGNIQQYQENQPQQVSKYEQQRMAEPVHPEDQESQYIEEEYYIEEEVEEDVEEETTVYEESHGVETIKEVSSEQENQSPGDCEPQFIQAMGSIAQTASLSSDKPYLDNKFSRSQKKIKGSGFKDMRANASSSSLNNAESNQASLVFKPKDSDGGNFGGGTILGTMNSNARESQKSRVGEQNSHTSHPSFGATQTPRKTQISAKWEVMLEKCAMRMKFKEMFVQINRIHEIFQRKQVHQELILSNQSQMQLKSFLDISMNSSQNVAMSQTELEAAFEDIRDRPLPQLQQELTYVVGRLSSRLTDYFKGESEILQQMAQERERNQFLEAELLSQREDRVRPLISQSARDSNDDHEMAATEQFIDELEAQLQQTRTELLSSKLQVSDQNVEIENLKVKLNSYYSQVHHIMEERRNFEESFEVLRSQLELLQSEKLELSQMIRERESTLAPMQLQQAIMGNQSSAEYSSSGYGGSYHKVKQGASNLASNNGQSHIKSQIESLNRQVYEATKRSESLQMVETNLLEKLDRKELENLELKDGFFELKQENQMKSDVISKAQKIIEKLTSKSDSDEKIMKRLNDECEGFKRDISEKNKMLSQLSDQMKEVQAKNNHDHTLMQHTMTQELDDVRNAVREYQFELETEKSKFMAQIASFELQLSQKESENERLVEQNKHFEEDARKKTETAEQALYAIQNQLREEEQKRIELKDQLKKQVALVEENAKNQIKYLQTRIKEIVEETQDSPGKQSIEKSTLSSSQKGLKSGGHSMIITIKKELNDMCQEVLALREALRNEGLRSDAMVNQKISKFDEFRLSVLDQLILWDEKTAELAGLAERYSGALEEQKKLFGKLKLVVQEKDQIIVELNRQIFMREQSQETHFEQLKTELIRSNQLMKNEMLVTVSLLEEKCLYKDKKMLELEDARISFRQEFTKIFQERNFYEQELGQVSDRLKFKEAELDRLQASLREQNQVYAEVLNIRSISINQTTVEHALRNLSNDAKRYSQEMVSYRDKLCQFEKDRGEERQLLNQKVASLEEQYANLQKQAIDKEEEQQLEFVQRESELINDLQNAQSFANKIEADLQTRERQLKKIQDKIEEDDKKIQDAYTNLEIVAQEKQNILAELHDSQGIIDQLEEELSETHKRLKQKDDLLSSAREDTLKERQSTNEKIATILKLEDELRLREEALENSKVQFAELEAKLRQVETRSMHTSKDLQDVYQELTWAKQAKNEIEREKQSLNLDISGLKMIIDKNKEDFSKKDKEIEQYQKTVMRQTRELEKLQEQQDIINEQKQRLHDFDNTIIKQVEQIESLKKEIKGPQKVCTTTQTIDSGMLELQYARQEVIKSQQCQEVVFQENLQLKEAMQRSSYEVCRLIEDKRELEDLIEKLNKNISYFRAQTQNEHLMASGNKKFESLTANNNGTLYGNELVSKVLAEKENYIGNLENEIDEMRKEIEIQREQLLQADTVTLDGQMRLNLSHQMSLGGGASFYQSQPYPVAPSSPKYLQNQGFGDFIYQTKRFQQKNQQVPNQYAPLRSTSHERQPYPLNQEAAGHEVPHKLQAQTIYNSTLSRTLTPIDNLTSSSNLKSGYFQPNSNNNYNNSNSLMNYTRDNQTQASNNILLNQTHYNSSQGGLYMRPQDASYLNANQSSVLMNYQSGLNNSVATHDKSSYRVIDRYQSAVNTALQGSPPEKGYINEYGNFTHA